MRTGPAGPGCPEGPFDPGCPGAPAGPGAPSGPGGPAAPAGHLMLQHGLGVFSPSHRLTKMYLVVGMSQVRK